MSKPITFNYQDYVKLKETIEEVKTEICDKYCIHPFFVDDQEELDRICESCPLERI